MSVKAAMFLLCAMLLSSCVVGATATGGGSELLSDLTSIRVGSVELTGVRPVMLLGQHFSRMTPTSSPTPEMCTSTSISFRLGSRWEHCQYLFNDKDPMLPGLLSLGGRWYSVPPEASNMVLSLMRFPEASTTIDARDDEALLAKYGYTAFSVLARSEVKLPSSFVHLAGEYPLAIYWAYHNELSKDIGFDMTGFLGNTVEVTVYSIVEPLPRLYGSGGTRAVVVRNDGTIAGAWLDSGYGLGCSLSGRTLSEVTGKSLSQWLATLIDDDDALEKKVSVLSPTEVVRLYLTSIDSGEYGVARACESRVALIQELFGDPEDHLLYSPGFGDQDKGGLSAVGSLDILEISKAAYENTTVVKARVSISQREAVSYRASLRTLIISLRNDGPEKGWRIVSGGF